MRAIATGLLTIGLLGAQAMAQQAAPRCPTEAAPLPVELAGWLSSSPVTAATAPDVLPARSLTIGKSIDLALSPTSSVQYVLTPERPGAPASYGGMASVSIEHGGTYRVALGSAAWIDLVRDNRALRSSGHGHGPACSGIRKIVDFKLEPGSYVLQIAGNGPPHVAVMIARAR